MIIFEFNSIIMCNFYIVISESLNFWII